MVIGFENIPPSTLDELNGIELEFDISGHLSSNPRDACPYSSLEGHRMLFASRSPKTEIPHLVQTERCIFFSVSCRQTRRDHICAVCYVPRRQQSKEMGCMRYKPGRISWEIFSIGSFSHLSLQL